MTRIEPLRIQIFNGSFTTLLILIVSGMDVSSLIFSLTNAAELDAK